jgi:hypothetical protein
MTVFVGDGVGDLTVLDRRARRKSVEGQRRSSGYASGIAMTRDRSKV